MAELVGQALRDLLVQATEGRVFPAATAEVGNASHRLWSGTYGSLTFAAAAPPCTPQTMFDLASLTKPLATTSLAMLLTARGSLGLDEPLSGCLQQWRGADREGATVQDLLEHSSGLAARLVDAPPTSRAEFEHDICAMPLECPPRSRAVYSDLGFILLGFIVEDRGGARIAAQFRDLIGSLTTRSAPGETTDAPDFVVPPDRRSSVAPTLPLTDDRRHGRLLMGEVHDAYAAALGGTAGHAGLFGTAEGVGRFARAILRAARGERSDPFPLTPPLVERMTTRSRVAGSSRALGWDTMLPSSSCGTELSPAAFGHVGFTGTSLWIDPVLDRYFVLLTNRACGGGTLDDIRQVRRAFHNIAAKLEG